MARKILITYGDDLYINSSRRLKEQAEKLKIFDEIIIYSPKDLPAEIKASKLFKYKRGGGYWIWKPWVIYDALSRLKEDDILVYSDSGNEVFYDKEWFRWFEMLDKKYNAIFFQYGGIMKKWTRGNLLSFFDELSHLKDYYQIQASLILIKRGACDVIEKWMNLMLLHPEFILDVEQHEFEHEMSCFIENRHDQAALSCVVYKNERRYRLKTVWQHSESRHMGGQACFNARISDKGRRSSVGKYEPLYVTLVKSMVLTPYRRIRMFILKTLDKK